MTISYNYDVSSVSIANFFKLCLRWKGSIYKNVKTGLSIWLTSYLIISCIYRFLLDDQYKHIFNRIAGYIEAHINNVPLQFLLGFFVSVVIDRWKQTFYNMGYIETVALTVSANLWGKDEESRLQRRAIIRYLVLHQVLIFRDISMKVRVRFPNLESLVTAGFANANEIRVLETLKFDYQRYWVPINWAISIVRQANDQKKFDTDSFMNAIVTEICKFRTNIQQLCIFDWVPVPLKYIQVVTMSVHIYFILCLISRQYLNLHDPESDIFDLYFPFATVLQFVFLFGWLQVAVDVLSPMGEGDDDFECNHLIDQNISIGLSIVDKHHQQPSMLMDIFSKDFHPMYSEESVPLLGDGLRGSLANINLVSSDEEVKMFEVVRTLKDDSSTTFRKRITSKIGIERSLMRNDTIRPVELGSSLPANINLNPDRPNFHHEDVIDIKV